MSHPRDRLLLDARVARFVAERTGFLGPSLTHMALDGPWSETRAGLTCRIEQFPVVAILSLAHAAAMSGSLVVAGPDDTALAVLHRGQVSSARLPRLPKLRGRKVVFRMCGWPTGSILVESLERRGETSDAELADVGMEVLIPEAVEHGDAYAREAGHVTREWILSRGTIAGPGSMNDVVDRLLGWGKVGVALDRLHEPDAQAMKLIRDLERNGVVTLRPPEAAVHA